MLHTNHSPDQPEFTNNWFEASAEKIWQVLLPQLKPQRILEVGSFEGRSACHIISNNNWIDKIELHCIDTWEGGAEHKSSNVDMSAVEERFDKNTAIAIGSTSKKTIIHKHKSSSLKAMTQLITDGFLSSFDFIYIDGSHQAPDVLTDAILGFALLRIGGIIAFDDYLWSENLPTGKDPIRCPKISIDAFTTIYSRKLNIINAPNHQLYIQKIAE